VAGHTRSIILSTLPLDAKLGTILEILILSTLPLSPFVLGLLWPFLCYFGMILATLALQLGYIIWSQRRLDYNTLFVKMRGVNTLFVKMRGVNTYISYSFRRLGPETPLEG